MQETLSTVLSLDAILRRGPATCRIANVQNQMDWWRELVPSRSVLLLKSKLSFIILKMRKFFLFCLAPLVQTTRISSATPASRS